MNSMKKMRFLTFTLLLAFSLFLPIKVATAKLKATLEGHTDKVWSVAFSPDGKTLASGSWDQTVRIWNVDTEELLHILPGHTSDVMSVAFSLDGSTLVSASWDRTIRLWNPRNGQHIRTLTKHEGGVQSVAFSPDGQTLASGSADQTVRLWDTTTWELKRTLRGHTHVVDSVAFSPEGNMLASGSRDKTIRLWNPHNGQYIRTLTGHTKDIVRMAFSPDGATLASGSLDQTVRLWDPNNEKPKRTLAVETGWVNPVAFSPDGATLLIGEQGISAWNTETGEYKTPYAGNIGTALSVVFSPDGQMVASGSGDNKVRLWDFTRYVPHAPFTNSPFDINDIPEPVPPPAAVQGFFDLEPFYQQWINVRGFPVLASAKVSPYAVKEVAWLIYNVTRHRPDVLRTMAEAKVRFSIIGHSERTTDIPELRIFPEPHFFYDIRNRGGYCSRCKTVFAPEETVLDEGWYSVTIHEFAHAFHEAGLNTIDPPFDDRLRKTYNMAMARGLWKNTYAGTNMSEYWAQGVGTWFNANPGFQLASTRTALKNYDPGLASLLTEIFGDGAWQYTLPASRTHLPHLQGFNPQEAPRLKHPPELLETWRQFTSNPNNDGGGKWMNLKSYDPSQLPSLNKSKRTEASISIYFMNHTGTTVLLYRVNPDGEEVHSRNIIPFNFVEFKMNIGGIFLVKDNTGKNIAVFLVHEETRGFIIRAFVGKPDSNFPESPPKNEQIVKITGPWLWMIAPTEPGQGGARSTDVDSLADASSDAVTEAAIARNGAKAGDTVGDYTWTLGKIAPTGGNNINVLINKIDMAQGDVNHHSAYALITLESATAQSDVTMRVGSDDSIKVWLNGEIVHNNPTNRVANDFQDTFKVNLVAGNNLLLVKVSERKRRWSMFVGINADVNAIYKPPSDTDNIEITVDQPADINEDGKVNKTDLLLLVVSLGENATPHPRADVNGDGSVNVADLLLVIENLDDPVNAAAPTSGNIVTSVNPTMLVGQLNILRAESDGSRKYQKAIAFLQSLLVVTRPDETQLLANYPNPFNPETWIPYQLAKPADVILTIYTADGKVVRTLALGHQRAGTYQSRSRAVYWDGKNEVGEQVASGIYLYTLTAGDFTATRKMLIRK